MASTLYMLGIIVVGLMILSSMFFIAIGLFVTLHVLRPQQAPADESNRINKIRLLWFCLTREELFVNTFPWLKEDELKNVTKKY